MGQFISHNVVGSLDNHLNFDYQDLERCERVARFLAEELKAGPSKAEDAGGLEFDDPLELIAGEMADLPDIINDVKEAGQAFDRLEAALGRMFALADRASEHHDPPDEQRRALLQAEFAGLAGLVAQLAGRRDYRGPELSLQTPAQARAARKILGYLRQARLDFSHRLAEQRRLINEAVLETIKTLGQLAANPVVDPAGKIPGLLVKIDLSEPGLGGFFDSLTRH